jgi:two-component system, OmpR family, sensor kinase
MLPTQPVETQPSQTPWHQRLYVRIWLAVIGAVVVLTVLLTWVGRTLLEEEREQHMRRLGVTHELVLRDAQGQIVAQGQLKPHMLRGPEPIAELPMQSSDGQYWTLEWPKPPRPLRPPPKRAEPWWQNGPGLVLLLNGVMLAVALGVYPVVRRLTKRLERLQSSVQRFGEGDLSARMPESGQDEVADLARRFNTAAGQIQALVVAQKSLLANASHELRSPLARIRMGLELLPKAQTNAQGHAQPSPAQAEIVRNLAELDALIEEILLASRLDAKEADLGTVEAVDLVGLCAEECARLDVQLDLQAGLQALPVPGVTKLLRRLVRNLLENALRYGTREGDDDAVVLELLQDGSHTVLRVCDRGPGVPAKLRERIFEPFYRLPGASESAGGVGLGLSLVKSIAERHQASISCTDRVGGGACFEVRFGR